MSACKASPDTTPTPCAADLALRLRAARLALKAKQDDLSALWELTSRQIVSDWERQRTVIPGEMIPKIEYIERLAAAGGKLTDAHREIAALKDQEIAQRAHAAHAAHTRWQAMGSRPVPLIEGATPAQQLELAQLAQPIPRPVPPPANIPQTSPQSADFAERAGRGALRKVADPYTTTIDWEGFVVEVEGVRGVSLRALVEVGGLFEQMPHAVRALKASGADFTPVREASRGGRPQEDYLMSLRDAQRFCARVRTDVGAQILDVILDHHDELQRLIAGDADAQARLADAQQVHAKIEQQAATDPLLGSLIALAQVRQTQLDHDARLEALEQRDRIRQEESERMLTRLRGVGLPAPTVEAPALSERKAVVAHLSRVGMDAGNGQDHHQAAWRHLYAQYEHRAGVDLKTRAKNAGVKPLDYAEAHGHLAPLYALACELWPMHDDAQA